MSLFRFGIAGILQLLVCTVCFAVDTPNFSGSWSLEASASKLQTSPKNVILIIKHQEPKMEVQTETPGLKDTRTYQLDGAKRKVDVRGIEMEISAKWKGQSLETRADGYGMTQCETWNLKDGGKILSIDRTVSGMVDGKEFLIYKKR